MTFIPGNYVTDGLIDLLRSNGFAFDMPTYFIWEGNVTYMPLANDKHTMLQLKRHVKTIPAVVRLSHRVGDHEDHRRCEPHNSRRKLRSDGRALAVRHRRYPSPRSTNWACRVVEQPHDRRAVSEVSWASSLFADLPALLDLLTRILSA